MTTYKIVQVRNDGLVAESQFSGWHAETAMVRFREEARNDKRTTVVIVFEGNGDNGFSIYSIG